MREILIASALVVISGCAAPFVLLVNPKNGTTVECSGLGRGIGSAMMVNNQVDACVQQYEGLGYVQATKLTDEQRSTIEIKPMTTQHRAVDLPAAPTAVIRPSAPSVNCTSNQVGTSVYTNCQ